MRGARTSARCAGRQRWYIADQCRRQREATGSPAGTYGGGGAERRWRLTAWRRWDCRQQRLELQRRLPWQILGQTLSQSRVCCGTLKRVGTWRGIRAGGTLQTPRSGGQPAVQCQTERARLRTSKAQTDLVALGLAGRANADVRPRVTAKAVVGAHWRPAQVAFQAQRHRKSRHASRSIKHELCGICC